MHAGLNFLKMQFSQLICVQIFGTILMKNERLFF